MRVGWSADWLLNAALSIVLFICVVTDVKSRLIYNNVIFPGLAAAFVLQALVHGPMGLLNALAGFAVGFALLLIPYLTGGMGAGDVKLLALIGAFKGTIFVLVAGAYMAVIGAGLALFALLARRGMLRKLQWIAFFVASLRYGVRLPLDLRGSFASIGYPYGVAIAGGAFSTMLFF